MFDLAALEQADRALALIQSGFRPEPLPREPRRSDPEPRLLPPVSGCPHLRAMAEAQA